MLIHFTDKGFLIQDWFLSSFVLGKYLYLEATLHDF